MELNSTFFFDHTTAFHFALSFTAIVLSFTLIEFFKFSSELGRHAMDARGWTAAANRMSPQGVLLVRNQAPDARQYHLNRLASLRTRNHGLLNARLQDMAA